MVAEEVWAAVALSKGMWPNPECETLGSRGLIAARTFW